MLDMAVSLISDWYEREPERRRSRIGIPNTALHILEVFRVHWPLREGQYLTSGGGQVAGLSGVSGDAIAARYDPTLGSMGTEAGRTSRSTPSAARRLAGRLNSLSRETATDPSARAALADMMQLWIVDNVLSPQLRQDARLVLTLRPSEPTEHALTRYVDAFADDTWKQSATRLLAAAAEAAIPHDVSTQGLERRNVQEGAIDLGDTSIIVSELPTFADIETCKAAIARGMRCLLLTPHDRSLASAQLLEAAGLSSVDVESLTRFVARLVDVASGFEADVREKLVKEINHVLAVNHSI